MFKHERIKGLREHYHLNQTEFVLELYKYTGLKVTRQTIRSWEKGCTTPNANHLYKIAQFFGIPVSYFFDKNYQYIHQFYNS